MHWLWTVSRAGELVSDHSRQNRYWDFRQWHWYSTRVTVLLAAMSSVSFEVSLSKSLNLYVLTVTPFLVLCSAFYCNWTEKALCSAEMFQMITKLSFSHPFVRKITENVAKQSDCVDCNGNVPWNLKKKVSLIYCLDLIKALHTHTGVLTYSSYLTALYVQAWWRYPDSLILLNNRNHHENSCCCCCCLKTSKSSKQYHLAL